METCKSQTSQWGHRRVGLAWARGHQVIQGVTGDPNLRETMLTSLCLQVVEVLLDFPKFLSCPLSSLV